MSKIKFLRRETNRYSKLGKRRKKKQRWKNPTGRDNKMRERRRGYPAKVSIGYQNKSKKDLKNKKNILVRNQNDLEKAKGNKIIVLGKIGKRKKIGIVEKAKEMKIKIKNLNVNKFLKKIKKKWI